ncbi:MULTISPECIES: adenylate/guanylate cyclase domain-containing protein [Deinococcus]|uniref:Adenylate/guanylate cyclase domain-containing protein n=1 Tax=Deinococcus rufus TaxID=2136097 RepID=A0ABV7Z511_9DEIO|nr:adenylate/guanylate cyclase domain-containing protein [Deinococcus sp. AB2017081]WQE95196.1 adenylate/guanylate cyclase domain-containing protein [Deinococcus sp. AB2017081]
MTKLLPLPDPPADTTVACLVLVDLVGSTELAHRLPIQNYMALMTEFVQVMILSLEARGAQVLQHQGDAVLAYWDARHTADACGAALDAHDRAARLSLAELLGVNLRLRSGVAVGEVLTGMVGGQRSAYGLPVNYARRLCDAAGAGETLVCGQVAAMQLPGLLREARAPLALQGFGSECETFTLRHAGALHMKVD